MFTGLVADVGRISARTKTGKDITFTIETSFEVDDLDLGESIAVDGTCLTVTEIGSSSFDVDASPETLQRTTLGDRHVGDGVHLERALRLSDRLGGHLVTGHIDGVGSLKSRRRDGKAWILEFEAPDSVSPYLLEKGCIAVDGVSLTINGVANSTFDLAIIPHTAQHTLLTEYRPGRKVNLEADLIGKYVRKFITSDSDGLSMDDLIRAGF